MNKWEQYTKIISDTAKRWENKEYFQRIEQKSVPKTRDEKSDKIDGELSLASTFMAQLRKGR